MATGKLYMAVFVAAFTALVSCSDKDPLPPPGAKPVTDQYEVRVRDIVVTNSPSPYYGFAYNDSGYVTSLNYASSLYIYHYYYKNQRIDSVTSTSTDARYLLYNYTGKLVTSVDQFNDAGKWLVASIQYDQQNRVSKMTWRQKSATEFDKVSEFTYYDDGNVKQLKTTYPTTGITSVVDYEAYDNKRGVDGFNIFKDFMDHVILLPGVRFQYNNPVRMKIVSGPNERIIRHDYVYRDSLPIERNSHTQVTAGPSAGQAFTVHTTFSYY